MPCDYPLSAYRSQEFNPETGRYGITFNPLRALIEGSSFKIGCGKCAGCRLDKSREWAVRAMHEAQLYEENCFITLTFADEHLPENYSIDVRDWQLFMKRLRKSLRNKKIRNLACGEYGEEKLRPHYHALLFNHSFNDKVLWKVKRGIKLYNSAQLSALWPFGHATVGELTFESAAYVARYNMKKQYGENAGAYYLRQHPITGLWHNVQPEALWPSRRPGLGAPWLERFKTDVYPNDFVLARGHQMKPPRFYDLQLPEEEQHAIKRARLANPSQRKFNNTPERREARRIIRESRMEFVRRNLEDVYT